MATIDAEPPRLPADTELMGKYEDSGLDDERYLVRRADGQVILLTALLYFVLEALNGNRGLKQVAAEVQALCNKPVTAENIAYLLTKLEPLGVIETGSRQSRRPRKWTHCSGWHAENYLPCPVDPFLAAIFQVLFLSPCTGCGVGQRRSGRLVAVHSRPCHGGSLRRVVALRLPAGNHRTDPGRHAVP
jgi:hypothetical protein